MINYLEIIKKLKYENLKYKASSARYKKECEYLQGEVDRLETERNEPITKPKKKLKQKVSYFKPKKYHEKWELYRAMQRTYKDDK